MTRRTVTSALLLVVSCPLFTGCYTTVGTSSGMFESVTGREAKPVADRVDLDAPRHDADGSTEVVARRTRLCRTQVTGTRTPYTDTRKTTTGMPWIMAFLLAPTGGGMIAFGQTDKNDNLLYGGIGVSALALGLLFMPWDLNSRDEGETTAFTRLEGDPFVCPGTAPAGAANLLIQINASFARAQQSLSLKTTTDANGVSRLTLPWLALTASHCGDAAVVVAPPAGALATGSVLGSVARWNVPSGAPVELGAAVDNPAVVLARSCCTASAAQKVHEACEERCTTAGMVEGCLFARRACDLKASQAGPNVAEGRKTCADLYQQCVVANGALLENLTSCVDACAAEQPATCR